VACPALQYVSRLSHKRNDFRKTIIEHTFVFLFPLQLLPETLLILRSTEREMAKMYIGLQVTYSLLLSDFNGNLNLVDSFSKNNRISNLMEIFPVGAELFHADGRT
jgi:hypothetical protein